MLDACGLWLCAILVAVLVADSHYFRDIHGIFHSLCN
jgi:hypothetical protein